MTGFSKSWHSKAVTLNSYIFALRYGYYFDNLTNINDIIQPPAPFFTMLLILPWLEIWYRYFRTRKLIYYFNFTDHDNEGRLLLESHCQSVYKGRQKTTKR